MQPALHAASHRLPAFVPMTEKLFDVLERRFVWRDPEKPWFFWHSYTSNKTGEKVDAPFRDRKKFMRRLCKKAEVNYFRFHPMRLAGASLMDDNNVPIGAIQRILGHEKRTTTEIYLHQISPSERDAIDVYERARQKSHTDSHTAKKGLRPDRRNPLNFLVPPTGLEPVAPRLGISCSIRLSYGGIWRGRSWLVRKRSMGRAWLMHLRTALGGQSSD